MNIRTTLVFAAALAAGSLTACSTYHESGGNTSNEDYHMDEAASTVSDYKSSDSSLARFFNDAYAYAVFPKITKGAAGIGAAHGNGGVVYQHGAVIGYATMTQITIGAQLGGQSFSEIVFFQNENALNAFKNNQTEFSANASAVMAHDGAAASADYRNGVAVFCKPLGGAMFEASIGGQSFKYRPR